MRLPASRRGWNGTTFISETLKGWADLLPDGAAGAGQRHGEEAMARLGWALGCLMLATVTLGLAAVLAWRGYWPILAIALIQVVLVLWILLRAWRDAWIVEELLIGAQQVLVRRSRYRDRREFRLEPAWARVRIERPPYPGYPPRVILSSVNQHVELGSHLTVDEKLLLAKHLADALAGVSAWRRPAAGMRNTEP